MEQNIAFFPEKAAPEQPEQWIPPMIESVPPPTCVLHIDADLPLIVLAEALASRRVSIIWRDGKLVITHRPGDYL